MLSRACPIAIRAPDSALSLVIRSLERFPVAFCIISFPYADLQLSEGVGGKAICVLSAVRRGVIVNSEAMGASEPCSAICQQLPGDGIPGDGGKGEN
jgi:hypothetical protein